MGLAKVGLLLTSLGCASATAPDPLSCFGSPLTGEQPNICSGSYHVQIRNVASAADCARKCLGDATCVQFVFSNHAEQQPNCRLSATCTAPRSASPSWSAYERKGKDVSGPCASPPPPTINFQSTVLQSGMVLQRDSPGTKLWGTSAHSTGTVEVRVLDSDGTTLSRGSAPLRNGSWVVALQAGVPARNSTRVTAALQPSQRLSTAMAARLAPAVLDGVAWGDVILCGGQSNMAFGTCGANSPSQSPSETLASLPQGGNQIRFFYQQGSIGGGAAASESSIQCASSKPPNGNAWCNVSANLCHSTVASSTPQQRWFNATATNSGSASAVCLLTAQRLHKSLGGGIPVGAVESCVGGTPVEPWTPPSVRVQIVRHARTHSVGESQSCMFLRDRCSWRTSSLCCPCDSSRRFGIKERRMPRGPTPPGIRSNSHE